MASWYDMLLEEEQEQMALDHEPETMVPEEPQATEEMVQVVIVPEEDQELAALRAEEEDQELAALRAEEEEQDTLFVRRRAFVYSADRSLLYSQRRAVDDPVWTVTRQRQLNAGLGRKECALYPRCRDSRPTLTEEEIEEMLDAHDNEVKKESAQDGLEFGLCRHRFELLV